MKAPILDLVKSLNHRAKILESKYSRVNVKELVNTGLFNLEIAQSGYGWLQDLHAMTVREVCFPCVCRFLQYGVLRGVDTTTHTPR